MSKDVWWQLAKESKERRNKLWKAQEGTGTSVPGLPGLCGHHHQHSSAPAPLTYLTFSSRAQVWAKGGWMELCSLLGGCRGHCSESCTRIPWNVGDASSPIGNAECAYPKRGNLGQPGKGSDSLLQTCSRGRSREMREYMMTGGSQDRTLSTAGTRQMEGHPFCRGWSEEERLAEDAGEFCKWAERRSREMAQWMVSTFSIK